MSKLGDMVEPETASVHRSEDVEQMVTSAEEAPRKADPSCQAPTEPVRAAGAPAARADSSRC